MTKVYLLTLALFSSLSAPLAAAPLLTGTSAGMAYQLDEVVSGLGVPWGMAFLSAGQLLITERNGQLKRLNTATGQLSDIAGLPQVAASGQGGLLDIAVPDSYQPGQWIYFTYSKNRPGGPTTVLARAKLQEDSLQNWQDLLISKASTRTGRHFGSRIAFDRQGRLFFSIGDRGERSNGQNLATHAGSILRLKLDGRVPADNPFIGQQNTLPEIWSYGHRNPQGLAYDHQRKRLWSIEHGPRGGDEINLIKPGLNYGWPVVSHGKEYWGPLAVGEATEKPGMENPVKVYVPSIAPGSLLLYSGQAFPHWSGNLFSGALKLQHLNRVELDQEGNAIAEERLLAELNERIRALAQSPEGWLYLSTDSGRILRLRPVVN